MTKLLHDLYIHGGVTFLVIVAMSVLALGISLERITAVAIARRRMASAAERVLGHLKSGERTMAIAVSSTLPSHPGAPLFAAVLSEKPISASELKRMQSRVARGSRGLAWAVGTIGAVAPFVGLFGTVLGIMGAFRSISEAGAGGFDIVSGAISEALIATAAGIAVGVEAMVFFNYLQVLLASFIAELRETVEELTEAVAEADRGRSSPNA